jgi:tetratricopeptide (TPR) repeat protein
MSLASAAPPGRGGAGRAAPAGLATLLVGLALIAIPGRPLADAFERTWCALESGTLSLITDRPRSEAEAMLARLRAFRPAAEQFLPGTPTTSDAPLRIVVFGHARDFRRALAGADVVGFMQPSLTENLMVVGPDPYAAREHETLLHEYTHYLVRNRTGVNLPTWLDEGLAGMLAAAEFRPGEVEIGLMPRAQLARTIDDSRLDLADVLAAEDIWQWRLNRRRAFYAWSHLLLHHLLLGGDSSEREARAAALHDFLRGGHESLVEALDVSPAVLQRRLERHLERRPLSVVHEGAGPASPSGAYRCLDASETARTLAAAIVNHDPTQAARRLRERLEHDPDDSDLWVALSLAEESAGDRDAAVAAARRASSLVPHGVDAPVRLAGALVMGCILDASPECRERWREAVPLLRRALAADPTRHDAVFVLGLAYLYSGRPGDALNYLRIVHGRQPWAPHVNFYLGEAYRLIGDREPAHRHLTRARQWSPTVLWRKLSEVALAELDG